MELYQITTFSLFLNLLPLHLASVRVCNIPKYPGILCAVEDIIIPKSVSQNSKEMLHILCFGGEQKHLSNIWKSVSIRVHSGQSNYEIFQEPNENAIIERFVESRSIFNFATSPLPWHTGRFGLALYNRSCFGVYSSSPYIVSIDINHINFWKISSLLLGLSLYFSAFYLSRNAVFYYSSGVLIGIFGSLLVIVFLLSRMIPKRIGALSLLVGGGAFALYSIQMLFNNITTIAYQYQSYAFAYVAIVGFISFAFCYKYCNVKDSRTQNIMRWTMQGIGLLLIFFSTEWHEASMCIILTILVIYNIPNKWKAKLRTCWKRLFPPKPVLISEDEYHEQAVRVTRAALEDLKHYCGSPDCHTWKLIKRLNDPLRFADFVNGGSHLSDEEILNYEMETTTRQSDSEYSDIEDTI